MRVIQPDTEPVITAPRYFHFKLSLGVVGKNMLGYLHQVAGLKKQNGELRDVAVFRLYGNLT